MHVAFSPDGRFLASGSVGDTVKVWDVRTGHEVRSLRRPRGTGLQRGLQPRRPAPGLGGLGQQGQGLGHDTGRELSTCRPSSWAVAWRVAFSPDGRLLALADNGSTGVVKVYDVTTGELALALQAHSGRVASITFSPDSRRLASAGFDRTVKLWDLTTGQEVLTLRGHNDLVSHVLFDPTAGAWPPPARTVRSRSGTPRPSTRPPNPRTWTLRGHTGVVYGVAFSPDGGSSPPAAWTTP